MAFERSADKIAGAKPHRKCEGEHDASKENTESQLDDVATDLKMVENQRRGKHQHQPLDTQRKKTSILQLRVDSNDKHCSRQKSGDEVAGKEQQDGADCMSEIRKQRDGKRCGSGIRSV